MAVWRKSAYTLYPASRLWFKERHTTPVLGSRIPVSKRENGYTNRSAYAHSTEQTPLKQLSCVVDTSAETLSIICMWWDVSCMWWDVSCMSLLAMGWTLHLATG